MSTLADWTVFFNSLFPNAPFGPQYAKVMHITGSAATNAQQLFADNDLDPRVADMITVEMLEVRRPVSASLTSL